MWVKICEHPSCGKYEEEHAAGNVGPSEFHKWVWLKGSCPIGDQPFHPTQTFKHTEEA